MAVTQRVSLSPTSGFCVKSTALNSVSCPLPSSSSSDVSSPTAINITNGLKVFVNIAWDSNVPPPPEGSDAAIERAMAAQAALDPDQAAEWFVPVIVTEPRSDIDKAGKPSVVFDCIFNSALKSRALRSTEFKTLLIELAFQRIEAQYSVLLSRQIGTPNIASKGRLKPRSVLIPISLYKNAPSDARQVGKPLIEELPPSAASSSATKPSPPKGILKTASKTSSQTRVQSDPAPSVGTSVPELNWSRTDDGRLRISLSVPRLTRASLPETTLDLEPRRLIFAAPRPVPYTLDLDLSQPDATIQKVFTDANSQESARAALSLKRERALDVDGARAEWQIAEGKLVIYA
ncbi:hypothetical protein DICSQDRAFT_107741 [Dichomitus squalens LYAD-421 SS1]|uniref:PIH1 N-terminal domain-containing protein n=1 Tax=Dichomitus squalens (strain LYAD-421) TaxID=732165 RepID=R7SVJ3_DICSQ|nr:uncharacterized protein DICSQDRAFT_107741 [Dichomitus squalens LYAD-421 SS1]EJF60086.1 hypothetical protein DICSQDRAFT_107741 [Dichomitus squalens LYAD-421 SS1]